MFLLMKNHRNSQQLAPTQATGQKRAGATKK